MPVLKGELLFAHPFPLLAKRSLHISDYFIQAKTETISSRVVKKLVAARVLLNKADSSF
jgi:hypothetical protein